MATVMSKIKNHPVLSPLYHKATRAALEKGAMLRHERPGTSSSARHSRGSVGRPRGWGIWTREVLPVTELSQGPPSWTLGDASDPLGHLGPSSDVEGGTRGPQNPLLSRLAPKAHLGSRQQGSVFVGGWIGARGANSQIMWEGDNLFFKKKKREI